MTCITVAKGSDFIYKALSVIGYTQNTSLVTNIVINVDMKKISISTNGNSTYEFCNTSQEKWNGLLKVCGLDYLAGKQLRSMRIVLLCDAVANVDFNILCEVK